MQTLFGGSSIPPTVADLVDRPACHSKLSSHSARSNRVNVPSSCAWQQHESVTQDGTRCPTRKPRGPVIHGPSEVVSSFFKLLQVFEQVLAK